MSFSLFLQLCVTSSDFAVDCVELWVWNVVMARRRWFEKDSGSEVVLLFVAHVHVHSLPLRSIVLFERCFLDIEQF